MPNRCPNPECENGQIYDGEYCSGCERAIGRMCPTCQDGTVDFDPRPFDMAELARLTAAELRKRGIWAQCGGTVNDHAVKISRPDDCMAYRWHTMLHPDFDNLGPVACADEIQRLEALRAQEWAGDK